MLFPSFTFLVFFVVVLGLLALNDRGTPKKVILLVASYVFYMWWNPAFILLIAFSTLVDYVIGKRMDQTDDVRQTACVVGRSVWSATWAFWRTSSTPTSFSTTRCGRRKCSATSPAGPPST